jgi:hypothetical protein
MIDYTLIKNSELLLLVKTSESINSLSPDRIQVMVNKIAGLPEDGQQEILAALRDEQAKVNADKAASGVTPAMEKKQLEASASQLAMATHGLEMEAHQAAEEASKKAEGPPEKILQSLSNP